MPNDKPYIERRYVELGEETEYALGGAISERTWFARVNGPVTPTEERVQMSRSSKSAGGGASVAYGGAGRTGLCATLGQTSNRSTAQSGEATSRSFICSLRVRQKP